MAPPPPPSASPPPDPAVLIDDLVGEFLVRLPPEDPAVLARAALVSKQWHRVVTGPGFRRRFREFHHSPPLLGYFARILPSSVRFVPTSSFRPRHADRRGVVAVHASHGRVLLQRCAGEEDEDPCVVDPCNCREEEGRGREVLLSVWNPITGEQQDLPNLTLNVGCPKRYWDSEWAWDAAVICADCKFKVILVGSYRWQQTFSCFYSSESDSWSDPAPIVVSGNKRAGRFVTGKCVPIGSALYFTWCSERGNMEILRYNLPSHQVCCTIPLRQGSDTGLDSTYTQIIATEDGRLGVAKIRNSTLQLWVREHGAWEKRRNIELRMLLPVDALRGIETSPTSPFFFYGETSLFEVGFAEIGGAGVIFLRTCVGYFTIDLSSGRSKKIGECLDGSWGRIVPYVSFCTPGAVFKNEGPGDGVAVSVDDVPGVAAAVSRDEEPGTAVAVCNDEGPQTGVYPVLKKLKQV